MSEKSYHIHILPSGDSFGGGLFWILAGLALLVLAGGECTSVGVTQKGTIQQPEEVLDQTSEQE